jgi:hypothetical protein
MRSIKVAVNVREGLAFVTRTSTVYTSVLYIVRCVVPTSVVNTFVRYPILSIQKKAILKIRRKENIVTIILIYIYEYMISVL